MPGKAGRAALRIWVTVAEDLDGKDFCMRKPAGRGSTAAIGWLATTRVEIASSVEALIHRLTVIGGAVEVDPDARRVSSIAGVEYLVCVNVATRRPTPYPCIGMELRYIIADRV